MKDAIKLNLYDAFIHDDNILCMLYMYHVCSNKIVTKDKRVVLYFHISCVQNLLDIQSQYYRTDKRKQNRRIDKIEKRLEDFNTNLESTKRNQISILEQNA